MTKTTELFPGTSKKPASHRQQRVAEQIRQIIAGLIMRGDMPVPELQTAMVSITHVDVSPDLRNAKIYIMPLGKVESGKKLAQLFNKHQSLIRFQMAKQLQLKFVPTFKFFYDEMFDRIERIDALITKVSESSPDPEDY